MRDGFNVVVYNPDSCLQIGAACGFFRAHAFAHERLNHSIIDVPSYYPPLFEQQADCWAAKYASTAEVVAAVQLLENPDSAARWRLNGDLEQRARIVRDCAIQAGNWTGTDQE